MNKYIVVFDTVTLIQSVINPNGASGKCRGYFERNEILAAVSRATLEEVREVLARPVLRQRFRQITDDKVQMLLETLLYKGYYLRTVPEHFSYPRDPKDEPIINLAVEAQADFIISRDTDLLDLMKWTDETGRDFQKRFRSLKIVTPAEFLELMDPQPL